MSNLLNDIASDRTSLSVCLQRLLIIANKIHNKELANWATRELNGYNSKEEVPAYRRFISTQIVYTGINGNFQITRQPIKPGYLNPEQINKVKEVFAFENIEEIQKRKDIKGVLTRDITMFADEIYKNTYDAVLDTGVQVVRLEQLISSECYSKIYSAVKTRLINTLCSLEDAKIDVDSADIKGSNISAEENKNLYQAIIVDGSTYSVPKKENKFIWDFWVPIFIGLILAIASALINYFFPK